MPLGNSLEEGLLRDVHSPAHRDRSPGAVAVAAIVWGVGGAIWLTFDLAPVPGWLFGFAVVLLGFLAPMVVVRAADRDEQRQRAAAEVTLREEKRLARRAAVKAARRSGAFDRWEKGSRDG